MGDENKKVRDEEDILATATSRLDRAMSYESDNRRRWLEDVRFAFDEDGQWEARVKAARGNSPCYTFNRIVGAIDTVIGEQRQNKPSIKVKAVGDDPDPKIAEMYSGLIRQIEYQSHADNAYDNGYQYSLAGGFGAWRICTDYAADDSFDQEIRIEQIDNPMKVYFDPNSKELSRCDAMWAFVVIDMTPEAFKEEYPGAPESSFTYGGVGDRDIWVGQDFIRVAEYWVKIPNKIELAMLSDGRTIELDDGTKSILDELANPPMAMDPETGQPVPAYPPVTVVKTRKVDSYKVVQYKLGGGEVLEGPKEWAGQYIPIVPVFGKTVVIDGEFRYRGIVRFAKDAQKSYNYHRSAAIEAVALAPKTPWLVTPKMLGDSGQKALWDRANADSLPYLPYTPDPAAPGGRPTREAPASVPVALLNEADRAAEEIRATMNLFEANLGAPSNETSGRAIFLRQKSGSLSTFVFVDNLNKAIEYTGQILIDLIPKIYDTPRVVRLLGEDGGETFVKVNQPVFDHQSQEWVKVNDLSVGRYDVVVTSGPSYATRRLEAAEQLTQLASQAPELRTILGDIIIKLLDLPEGDEILKRLRKVMITQGIVQPGPEDEIPEQGPPPPSPADVAAVNKDNASAQKYRAEAMNTAVKSLQELTRLGVSLEAVQAMQSALMPQEAPMPIVGQNTPEAL